MSKLSTFGRLWQFMRVRKKWWLVPLIVIIVILGFMQALPTQQTDPMLNNVPMWINWGSVPVPDQTSSVGSTPSSPN